MHSAIRNTLKYTFALSKNSARLASSSGTGGGSAGTKGAPIAAAPPADRESIGKLVKNNKVVVFMKGIPEAPKCGFSNAVVQVLRMHGIKYDSHDVLENESLRQGIKDFTEWPTIPQVFIDGEFIGGCDIMLQKHQSGELIEELQKVGIRSALLDSGTDENK